MSDGEMRSHEELEAELEDLGPLMAQQEIALGTEPDPEFVRSLRNRLTGEGEIVPTPAQPSVGSRLSAWARKYWAPAGGLAAAVAVALIVVIGGHGGTGSPIATPVQSAFHLPRPGSSDVTRSYPAPGGLGGGPPPVWYSSLQPPPGVAYAGHLTLRGAPLPAIPGQAAAYQLDGPGFDLPRLRALAGILGIAGRVRHMAVGADRWAYVAQQSGPEHLHSIAVNQRTGELVYHNIQGNPSVPNQVTAAQRAAARAWLSTLGWPGTSMPVRRSVTEQEAILPSAIRFNWPQVTGDVPAASVMVDTSGTVIEAILEPPVSAATQVTVESRQAAWSSLRQRGGPIGVVGAVTVPAKPGTATLTDTALVEIVAHAANGRMYLVPSYRFEGNATISGVPGTKRWIAIVPAAK